MPFETEKLVAVRVGIDVGGTFTDLVLFDSGSAAFAVHKVPSTPDVVEGIVGGLGGLLAKAGVGVESVSWLAHGTTVATNAVLQQAWAPAGLLTTKGFRDIVEIRQQIRPDDYDLRIEKPTPVVPRRHRLEIDERTDARGQVIRAVAEHDVLQAVEQLVRDGVTSVAICFLHSYTNSANEDATAAIIADHYPDLYVTKSSELVPEFREYPRASTTSLNGALQPVMTEYLTNLGSKLRSTGVAAEPAVLGSDGTLMSLSEGSQAPVRTLGSGPSAGVIGARAAVASSGVTDFVTLDMGGTSTEVCLVSGGAPTTTTQREISGYPIKYTSLDIHSIGAGGGSLASVDEGGFLQVGPASAGATPGPACYGRGGVRATVTDANVVLGRLNPDALLDGRMPIDAGAAEAAVMRDVGEKLGLDAQASAAGVVRLVVNNMVRAVRLISVERGKDPRDFWLVAFGGAGPLHALDVAREVGFKGVIVPEFPGLLCGAGVLAADIAREFVRTSIVAGDDAAAAGRLISELSERALEWAGTQGLAKEQCVLTASADMRYRKQSFEITVPLGGGESAPRERAEAARGSFKELHRVAYGYSSDDPIEFVTFRVRVAVATASPTTRVRAADRSGGSGVGGKRLVYFEELREAVPCPVMARDELEPGSVVSGPVVLEQMDSTCVIPPGLSGSVDADRNLQIPLLSD